MNSRIKNDKSLSPIEHVNHIRQKTIIRVISGGADEVVFPELGKTYTELLLKNHIDAKFYLGLGMKHDLSDAKTGEMVVKILEDFLNSK